MPMRKIVPLDTTGLIPADLSKQKQFDIDLVDPRDCYVEEFQRDFAKKSEGLAEHIFQNFSYPKFNVPVACRVDGKICIINGQTTVTACASHPEIRVIPVLIVDVPEVEERARAFVSHSRDRVQATPGQIWHGLLKAGDAEAVTTHQVCEAAGLSMLKYPPAGSMYKPGESIALRAVEALIKLLGAEQATIVLAALVDAGLAPVTADFIKAGGEILSNEEYRGEFDLDRLATTIRSLGPRAISEAKALAAAKGLPLWRALAATIYKHRRGKAPVLQEPTTHRVSAQSEEKHGQVAQVSGERVSAQVATKLKSTARLFARPPEPATYTPGDPPPGRSALDQRRAAHG